MTKASPLLIIDGHALAFRSFYAMPPLSAPDGTPTGAIHGFLRKLFSLVREKPAGIAVAFDGEAPTFRSRIAESYKATRRETPPELVAQLALLPDLVHRLGFRVFRAEGFEADDLIATLVRRFPASPIRILSGDKDLASLVSPRVHLRFPGRKRDEETLLDPRGVEEKYGVAPTAIPDLLALMGDSSDNIPGVPGIGAKKAVDLLRKYGSVDSLLQHLDELPPGKKKVLCENRDSLDLSRQLVRLRDDVPIELDERPLPQQCPPIPNPDPGVLEELERLGLKSIIKELQQYTRQESHEKGRKEGEAGRNAFLETVRILEPTEIAGFVRGLKEEPYVVVDTETTSLSPHSAQLLGIAFAAPGTPPAFLPLDPRFSKPNSQSMKRRLGPLRAFLADARSPKVGHHFKYDLQVLWNAGFETDGFVEDTMLAAALLDPTLRTHSLKNLAERELGYEMISFDSLGNLEDVSLERLARYAAGDAAATEALHRLYQERLTHHRRLATVYRDIEVPLERVLAEMEWRGVRIDKRLLKRVGKEFRREMEALEKKAVVLAGRDFNVASTQQLAKVLFDEIGLKARRKTKQGFSTDSATLEALVEEHPLPGVILEYREVAKLLNTYINPLLEMIHPATGRLHTSFSQVRTATGRLASSNPNLQNIPIRTERGRRIREAFVAEQGHVLIAADYSQIEFRIAVILAEEEAMLEAFEKGYDIHAATASRVWGVPYDDVPPDLRRKAKAVNFGILYGQSPFGLSRSLRIPMGEAKEIIETYFQTFPRLRRWIDSVMEKAEEENGVETWYGRYRPLPEINSSRKNIREAARRMAVNTVVQGTAADIIKLAMIACRNELESLPGSAMILQVHDELLVETPTKHADEVARILKDAMTSIEPFGSRLSVSLGRGRNWNEAGH
ncbi:MAG: DNA polymerase I [Candidatus Hydrogenedentota bacterium]|nr:MAG: DNA polymerase I [Candidatus Hydrogenedentota bacterium]